MAFLTRRYEDQSRPTVKAALRDLAVRAILPATVLLGVIIGFGYILKGPLFELSEDEKQINRDLQDARDGLWNSITHLMSSIGNTEYVIGVCLIVVGLVWWRTKQWWYAVVPGIAISLQATVFVIAAHVVGRARPTVERLAPDAPDIELPERARRRGHGALPCVRAHGDAHRQHGRAPAGDHVVRAGSGIRRVRAALPGGAPRDRHRGRHPQRGRVCGARLALPASEVRGH